MPHLHDDRIKFLEDQHGQNVQDKIFRTMSIEKKIRMTSDFFDFAKTLNKLGSNYGTRKAAPRNRRNT